MHITTECILLLLLYINNFNVINVANETVFHNDLFIFVGKNLTEGFNSILYPIDW